MGGGGGEKKKHLCYTSQETRLLVTSGTFPSNWQQELELLRLWLPEETDLGMKECCSLVAVSHNNTFKTAAQLSSVQFILVAQSCPTACSTGLPVHHQLPEFTQIHVHWVGDAIQLSHPLSSLSPPTFNRSQHQGLFQWVSSWHQVAKVLEFQLQHQSFQWIFRTHFL